MSDRRLIPSIEMRLGSLLEMSRRREMEKEAQRKSEKHGPTITISREFGCEAFPMAERLQELLEKKSGEKWLLMDKLLLEEVSRNHNLSEELLKKLGEKMSFLDEILATFSPRWKTEKDYNRLLCRQIISLANNGNVIIVGRGAAFITQQMEECHHFRLYAPSWFKNNSIAKRLGIPLEEAEEMVIRKQQQRDKFIRDFLNCDAHDLNVYNLAFNNEKNKPEKIAKTIMEYIYPA
jgi:cytidylate kinase